MDPDQALDQLIAAMIKLLVWRDGQQHPEQELNEALVEAMEAVEALEKWRQRGGVLPGLGGRSGG